MYRIKTLNKISAAGLARLDPSRFQVGDDLKNEDGILVRSAPMHDYEFPDALRAIARAGAGTNNIPIDRCSENGIVVFNTPGANANAVKRPGIFWGAPSGCRSRSTPPTWMWPPPWRRASPPLWGLSSTARRWA